LIASTIFYTVGMRPAKHPNSRGFITNPLLWIGVIAAILYSSWPLGYLLNPVAAHTAFASQLEEPGQPYSWLFVALDLISAAGLITVGVVQLARIKGTAIRLSIISYIIFAALVIVAAVVPSTCDSATDSCQSALGSPLYIIHGLASIASPIALLVSLFLIVRPLLSSRKLRLASLAVMLTIAIWGLNGVAALGNYHKTAENLVQYAFITTCSLSMILAVVFIEYLSAHRLSFAQEVSAARNAPALPLRRIR
jgi:hypothetical protein